MGLMARPHLRFYGRLLVRLVVFIKFDAQGDYYGGEKGGAVYKLEIVHSNVPAGKIEEGEHLTR